MIRIPKPNLIIAFSSILLILAFTANAEENIASASSTAGSTEPMIAETGPIIQKTETYLLQQSDKETSTTAMEGGFNIFYPAGHITASSSVEVVEITEGMKTPWKLDRLSQIYQFDIKSDKPVAFKKTIKIEIAYDKVSNHLKTIFFYDKTQDIWKPLPTRDFPEKKTARAEIALPFARLAVFADPDVLMIGTASWYKFKTGNYAASPDFPKGSKLRVYNLDNNKSVDVEINDFGPERLLYPDRVIDLEKTAFAKIASVGSGLAKVRVEYLGSVDPKTKKAVPATFKVRQESASLDPKTKSAIVMNEKTGEVLFDKNSSSTDPLASLTKLVAAKTFLDTRPSLATIVKYSVQDEKLNFQYVDHPWESARIKLSDGETLSIEDLLYSALVGSANNAVESLVRVSGLTRPEFIRKMNENTALWGATSTRFIEPTGLSPENVSSPSDYAIITKEVLKNPIIEKASSMGVYKFTTRNKKIPHTLRNTNNLIESSKFRITGSKTGYLHEAGYCLMTRAKSSDGQQVIVITFGAGSKADSVGETKNLLYYGLRKLAEKI